MPGIFFSILLSAPTLNVYGLSPTTHNTGGPNQPDSHVVLTETPALVGRYPEPTLSTRPLMGVSSHTKFAVAHRQSRFDLHLRLRPRPKSGLHNFARRVERWPAGLSHFGARLRPKWQFIPVPTFSCSLLTPPQSPLGFVGVGVVFQPPLRRRK